MHATARAERAEMLESIKQGLAMLVALQNNPAALIAVVAIGAFALVGYALHVLLKISRRS